MHGNMTLTDPKLLLHLTQLGQNILVVAHNSKESHGSPQVTGIWVPWVGWVPKQGRHGKFEPGKAQYSTPNFFDQLFLIRAY